MAEHKIIQVPPDVVGKRVDRFLSEHDPSRSRAQYHRLFEKKKVTLNGEILKPSYRVHGGEQIAVDIPHAIPMSVPPEEIPLDILFEDKSLIVINKPAGMVVHPGAGNWTGTLVNALLHHCKDLSGIGGVDRPGIVHRIDKDTSGLLVVAKNDQSHRGLSKQLEDRIMTRTYKAIVRKEMRVLNGKIEAPIGRHPTDRKKMSTKSKSGKEALTFFHVIERFKGYTYIELKLKTGRTHQIRVHLSSIGHSIVGDQVYGGVKGEKGANKLINRQALHAESLSLTHPETGERLKFSSPLPDDFEEALTTLRASGEK